VLGGDSEGIGWARVDEEPDEPPPPDPPQTNRLGSLIVSSGTTPATGHFDNLVIQRVAERGR
jgi:hypothetical protein